VNQAGVGGVTLAASGADIQATVTGAANKNLTWAFKVDARPLLTP
jgi:hypothetical protein